MENENSAVAQPTDAAVPSQGDVNLDGQEPVATDPAKDFVKYETYKRVLNENKKHKEMLAQRIAAEAEAKKKDLEAQNNYKVLYENTDQKLKAVLEDKNKLEDLIGQGVKYNAVVSELNKKGIRCIDMDAMFSLGNTELLQTVDMENVDGVEAFIDDAKKSRPYLFASQDIPRMNQLPATFNPGQQVTKEDFIKLPKEAQQAILNNLRKG
jgi:hypothetical protein